MDTSSLDCKHKHMLIAENGAPPDKFGYLYRVLHVELHGFNNRIDASGLSHFGSWYQLNIFRESMGPFNTGIYILGCPIGEILSSCPKIQSSSILHRITHA